MPTTRRKGSSSTTRIGALAVGTGSTQVAHVKGGQLCDKCAPISRAFGTIGRASDLKGSSSTTRIGALAVGTGSTQVAHVKGGQLCDKCAPISRAFGTIGRA